MTGPPHFLAEGVDRPSVGPGHHQVHVVSLRREMVERPHERGVVLSGLHRAEGQDVAVGARHAPARGGVAGGNGRHTGRDREDARGIGAEQDHHLLGHERGEGVHRRASGDRPAQRPQVGTRLACPELGKAEQREVGHRDDTRRPPRPGHHEVGAVQHVGPAAERSHPGPPHTHGQREALRAKAPPGLHVRGHVQLGQLRQRLDRTEREHPDTRTGAQERRGVEGDTQTARRRLGQARSA